MKKFITALAVAIGVVGMSYGLHYLGESVTQNTDKCREGLHHYGRWSMDKDVRTAHNNMVAQVHQCAWFGWKEWKASAFQP